MSAFINNFYGTYIEHIDTYVQSQDHATQQSESVNEPPAQAKTARDVILMPQEGDYSALVKWLEMEKKNGNDYLAEADYNRSKMCRNLLKIIGWEPNQDSLQKAQNR